MSSGRVVGVIGTNTRDLSLAAIGSTPNANGASIDMQVLTLQPASASFGGIITTGTQTIPGDKTFTGTVTIADLVGGGGGSSVSLDVVGSTPNDNAATVTDGVLVLQPADATHAGLVSTTSQTFAGDKTLA